MTDGDTPETADRGTGWSRRRAVAALSAGAGWLLTGTPAAAPARAAEAAGPAATAAPTPTPPGLPSGIPTHRHVFVNWSGEVRTDALWTCAPRDTEEVVALADWAAAHGWRLRPRGKRHTWAPLAVADGTAGTEHVLLLDTTAHLTTVSLDGPDTVRAGAGVLMEELLDFLGDRGLGLTSCPAPGDLTLGGVLAIGGHGTAVPARGEEGAPGQGYGSVSNRVVALTAVVWDEDAGRHVARTFGRADPACAALLVHLGRALVTEVVLRVEQDATLRCVSTLDVPASRLFAAPEAAGGDSFAAFLDRTGRAEAIWFAFTDHPWLKTWQRSPRRPFASRAVDGPYNYPFSDNLPEPVARLAGELAQGSWALTPLFGRLQYAVARAALTGDISDLLLSDTLLRDLLDGEALRHLLAAGPRSDLWGASRHLLLYIRPTTLRETADGYAVLVRRRDVQWVVHTFATVYRELLEAYASRGEYPVNGQVEIRVTGVDDPSWAGTPGALAPALSAVTPRPDHPEWDTAVWLDVLTLPGTPGAHRFYRELERALFAAFDGTERSALRVEWSKGWAYTDEAAWSDAEVIGHRIPDGFPAGPGNAGWEATLAMLRRLDPHGVLESPLLRDLMAPGS